MDDTPLVMVETDQALVDICQELATAPVLGVDTESDSMYSYREKVCLIQISDAHRDYIVDPLKVSDMSPLGALLSDPDIVKIFHGADYDVVCMHRDYGFRIRNLFDTMIAAQLLELPKFGLGDLVERFFGVSLDKQYQRHDWSKRPLLPEHVEYARGDTHFLLALREILELKLSATDRRGPAAEEFELLQLREWGGRTDDGEGWRRVKRTGHLVGKQQRVLREVWRFRDELAAKSNRPPYKVIPDRVLIDLAEKQPTDLDELGRVARRSSNMVKRYGEGMVAAVVKGLETDEPIRKKPRASSTGRTSKTQRHSSRETEKLFTQLKEWRKRYTKAEKVPMVLTASNAQLKAVAGFRPQSLEELASLDEIRNWQVERIGDALLAEVVRFEKTLARSQSEREPTGNAPGNGSGKRRRRRRRKSGGNSGGEG